MPYRICYLTFFTFLLLTGCSLEKESKMFRLLSPDDTGITFSNTIETNDSVNVQTDSFIYNGAGVAVGDINNNGLPDLFFSGNMVSSRLYLNKGDFKFEDITQSAGLETRKWVTGVSLTDINNDGFLDIYLSVSGPDGTSAEERANMLFINNGDNTFTESAAEYKIDDTGFTTHAVFFDYNRDGYLDLFLLGNSPGEFRRGETGGGGFGSQNLNPDGFDQLYRNNGDGSFTNVSEEAGILRKLGYGLGVVAADLNGNGWPDLYVSNDITPNDVLYINNKDGTFTNKAADWLRHTSFAGMGIDIADFTNNGWLDILQTDMMSEYLGDRKRMSGSNTYGGQLDLRRNGYFPHYNLNTLQMNNGVTEQGDVVFSQISRMAGVAYTDWSWTALFADFDNDGWKDALITNGYPKAVNDFDYLSDMHNARSRGDPQQTKQNELEILENLHSYEVPNYIFKNNRDLTFTKKTEDWGMNHAGFSYGAAYADLNNNGRLDLVVNNINAPAFIYENTGISENESHFLQIKLRGESPNTRGIGSRLILYAGNEKQYIYHTPYRGYMSTMDDRIHFGLSVNNIADSLEIIWPDGRYQVLSNIDSNQLIEIHQADASDLFEEETYPKSQSEKIFQPLPLDNGLNDTHRENHHSVDFGIQSLLPYMVSNQGPVLAVGDITGNGLDDLYIGGSRGIAGRLFVQQHDGSFTEPYPETFETDRHHEDWGAHFFDANGNGQLDLYVASGGYQLSPASDLLQDRLYINRGDGRFLKNAQALPQMLTSTSAVTAGDFTGDGNMDLFIGGRITPMGYPKPARSYILQNNGGQFVDITQQVQPELADKGGMITDAIWVDFDMDGKNDLVTVGEWMTVQFFNNDGNRLQNITESLELPPLSGWWYSIAKGDFNNNGYPDLVVGNLGLNHTYTTSSESKFGVYAGDFSNDRNTNIIFTKEFDGNEYPFYGLATLGREIQQVAMRFSSFESFSDRTVTQIFGASSLSDAIHYQADTFASHYLENNADGTFTAHPLPNEAQISPANDLIINDADGDGHLDIILAGNNHQTEPNTPRADAGNGLWLKGNGDGTFKPAPLLKSGFLTPFDVRSLELMEGPKGKIVIAGNNNEKLQLFRVK